MDGPQAHVNLTPPTSCGSHHMYLHSISKDKHRLSECTHSERERQISAASHHVQQTPTKPPTAQPIDAVNHSGIQSVRQTARERQNIQTDMTISH
mmetsp:Transcript_43925/g.124371  ORF Transcript_43925/g.124371 Transcript_43925/m.124371 type:complete len:95 (-) Transcript_43925:398-682(-)